MNPYQNSLPIITPQGYLYYAQPTATTQNTNYIQMSTHIGGGTVSSESSNSYKISTSSRKRSYMDIDCDYQTAYQESDCGDSECVKRIYQSGKSSFSKILNKLAHS